MTEGFGSMISVIVVMVFLYVVFRKKILPYFGKKTGKPAVPAVLSDNAGKMYCDVLVFDISSYPELTDLSEGLSLRLTQKFGYVDMKGEFVSLDFQSVGSLFFAVVRYRVKE